MDSFPSGKRLRRPPRTRWQNYVANLARLHLEIPPTELPLVAGGRDAWRSQLKLLPPTPKGQARKRKYTELI